MNIVTTIIGEVRMGIVEKKEAIKDLMEMSTYGYILGRYESLAMLKDIENLDTFNTDWTITEKLSIDFYSGDLTKEEYLKSLMYYVGIRDKELIKESLKQL